MKLQIWNIPVFFNWLANFQFVLYTKWIRKYKEKDNFKGVGFAFKYLSIMPQNNSRTVVKNLRILVCRSSLRLTIPYLILKI
jgi:hypothetical protein